MTFNGPWTLDTALRLLRVPPEKRAGLYAAADRLRAREMGDGVPLRGIVEYSNRCVNDCLYCGIRRSNRLVRRYRLGTEEIMAVARSMPGRRRGTVVLQAGEWPSPRHDRRLGELIRRIKAGTPLAVTLSAGNRPCETYAFWRDCGMDRYLLRFECGDPAIFAALRPGCTLGERLACLRALRSLGVQVGSGFMIGLPGESDAILAGNILLCRELGLDMIGVGPFIPHPATPLAGTRNRFADDPEMFFVVLAVLRLFNPRAHIPATTAYDALFPGAGRELALQRGANVFMPNDTPRRVRGDYLLYPGKPDVDEDAGEDCRAVRTCRRLAAIGRVIEDGPGHSRRSGEAKSPAR
jgi:biotin synthase